MNQNKLQEPVNLAGFTLKNALIRSATNENMANAQHEPSDKMILYYAEMAKHVGMIITGFAYPDESEMVCDHMLGLFDASQLAQYQYLCESVHASHTSILLQMVAGGNKKTKTPVDYTVEELHALPSLFVRCAALAKRAGFDGVQLHLAHGYVLSQFLSPLHNTRKDEYGGSFLHRIRLTLEILDAIHTQLPDFHISAKLHCDDYEPNGFSMQESLALAQQLQEHGLSSLEISGGNYRSLHTEGFYIKEATVFAKQVTIPVFVVGGNTDLTHMQKVFAQTNLAGFSMSRALTNQLDLLHHHSTCTKCGACYTQGTPCVQQLKDRMLFASDFDGTLSKDHYSISLQNSKAIQAYSLHHLFGVVSGRDPISLVSSCQNAHLPYDFLICFNGGLIIDLHGDILYEQPITQDITAITAFLRDSSARSYHCVGLGQACMHYKDGYTCDMVDFEKSQFGQYELVSSINDLHKVYMITCEFPDDASALSCAAHINATFPYLQATANSHFIDIMEHGVCKERSIAFIQQYYHVDTPHTYVIGDSYNDMAMLKAYPSFAIKGVAEVENCALHVVEEVYEALAMIF